jgi:hypothetical protein
LALDDEQNLEISHINTWKLTICKLSDNTWRDNKRSNKLSADGLKG